MPPRARPRGELLPYADAFSIDLNAALLEQLPRALDILRPVALTEENLAALGPERGVYQLFHQRQSVYFGKSQEALCVRLSQHRRRCMGRLNIEVLDMSFRCLYVDKFVDAAAPEAVLIRKYRDADLAPWNIAEGFAPKDVGRGRASGAPGQWFIDRPIRHDVTLNLTWAGRPVPVVDALAALKRAVAFDLFRYASTRSRNTADRESAADYRSRVVNLDVGEVYLMTHLRRIVEALPVGWQATVQPPGVTIYREAVDYPYAIDGWRHEVDGVVRLKRGRALAGTS